MYEAMSWGVWVATLSSARSIWGGDCGRKCNGRACSKGTTRTKSSTWKGCIRTNSSARSGCASGKCKQRHVCVRPKVSECVATVECASVETKSSTWKHGYVWPQVQGKEGRRMNSRARSVIASGKCRKSMCAAESERVCGHIKLVE
jgi:hypothetical protein